MKCIGLIIIAVFLLFSHSGVSFAQDQVSAWPVRSIDTMKFSRDLAREKLRDPNFQLVIDKQIHQIAESGATHVAIGTPYDAEFLPFLRLWVDTARRHRLNVWFRGNFSGWEGWFRYSPITRVEHREKTVRFIAENGYLFRDGDIFTSCPECENGGPGDPRENGDVAGHREFLIEEYLAMQREFSRIGKRVEANYFSMNADVARLVMDEETVERLDRVIVIDHYVSDPQKLAQDVAEFIDTTGAIVVLGEFGAPIPDIHGMMTPEEQKQWLTDALIALSQIEGIQGLNYWVHARSTTALWSPEGLAYPAQEVLAQFYLGEVINGTVVDESGKIVKQASLVGLGRTWSVGKDGSYHLPYFSESQNFTVHAPGFITEVVALSYDETPQALTLTRDPDYNGGLFGIIRFFQNAVQAIIGFFSGLSFTFSLS